MKHYTLPIVIERDAEGFYVSWRVGHFNPEV
jgi:hypothetical protein